MAVDGLAYLRELQQRGYELDKRGRGGHVKIRWKGRLVAVGSVTPGGGRGLANLKSYVRRFERGLQS